MCPCAFVLFKRIFTWIECESDAAIKFILHRKNLFLDSLMGKHRLRYKYDLVHVASLVATIRLSRVVFIHCNQPKSVAVRMHQLSVMFELWKSHTHTSFFFGSLIVVCFSGLTYYFVSRRMHRALYCMQPVIHMEHVVFTGTKTIRSHLVYFHFPFIPSFVCLFVFDRSLSQRNFVLHTISSC